MTTTAVPDITAEILTITPEIAEEWLQRNTRNRAVKRGKIEQMARDMVDGRWQLTGEAIKFAADGTLLDGQNRLHAIIRADVAVQSLVVRGVPTAAQDVMDSGTARTAADALKMSGFTDTFRVTAAARLALTVENDTGASTGTRRGQYSNSEVQEWVLNNPDICDTANITGQHRGTVLIPSVLTYCAWRLARLDEVDAKTFFTGLVHGADLSDGSPILALRNRLGGSYGAARATRPDEQVALVFRAWNAFRAGERLSRLVASSRSGRIAIPTPL